MAEVPSKGIFLLAVDPKPVHASSEGNEGSKVPLLHEAIEPKVPSNHGRDIARESHRKTNYWRQFCVSHGAY